MYEQMGVIEHEIGHVLGMFHEHQRPDRNDYITVHRGNIQLMRLENFVLLIPTVVLGVPYDYSSVMHYGSKVIINILSIHCHNSQNY